jgi:hypothetical protein
MSTKANIKEEDEAVPQPQVSQGEAGAEEGDSMEEMEMPELYNVKRPKHIGDGMAKGTGDDSPTAVHIHELMVLCCVVKGIFSRA